LLRKRSRKKDRKTGKNERKIRKVRKKKKERAMVHFRADSYTISKVYLKVIAVYETEILGLPGDIQYHYCLTLYLVHHGWSTCCSLVNDNNPVVTASSTAKCTIVDKREKERFNKRKKIKMIL
jgi:hypothetical protein